MRTCLAMINRKHSLRVSYYLPFLLALGTYTQKARVHLKLIHFSLKVRGHSNQFIMFSGVFPTLKRTPSFLVFTFPPASTSFIPS